MGEQIEDNAFKKNLFITVIGMKWLSDAMCVVHDISTVSYTHLRDHETPEQRVWPGMV